MEGLQFVVLVTIVARYTVLSSAETYYVTPSPNTPCPEEGVPCFTLSQYANKSTIDKYFASNTTLIFLLGNHIFDSKFSSRNISAMSIESDSASHSNTSITCYESARFIFESVSVVSMRGLALLGCVNNEVIKVEELTVEDCSFDGEGCDGTGLHLVNVSIATITRSSFTSNTGREIEDPCFHNGGMIEAGGAIIMLNTKLGITFSDCLFQNNTMTGNDYGNGGALYACLSSNITIINSEFNSNTVTSNNASYGGAVDAYSSPNITIVNSTFYSNTVTGKIEYGNGGAVHVFSSPNMAIVNSTLNSNTASGYQLGGGGAVFAYKSPNVTIVNSTLNSNTVTANQEGAGGAVFATSSPNITIINSKLNNNAVTVSESGFDSSGGAMDINSSPDFMIVNSTLNNNSVTGPGVGGAMNVLKSTIVLNDYCAFRNNSCTGTGSVFYFRNVTFKSDFLDIQSYRTDTSVLYAVQSTLYFTGNTTVSNNNGSLFLYACNVTFMGYTNMMNNKASTSDEGGALTAHQSEIVFMGKVNLVNNTAIRGGAIVAAQSKLYNYGNTTISHNIASMSGGGIYAYQSELNFMNHINISRNTATIKGGGIHAISSTTRLTNGSKTNIIGNHAERGGGLCLEGSAKVYLLRSSVEINTESAFLHLKDNSADYGGAVYVADNTTSDTCSVIPFSESDQTAIYDECFIQGIALYAYDNKLYVQYINSHNDTMKIFTTNFTNNRARLAGDVLYGGLLDRCRASLFAEIFYKFKYQSLTPSSLSAVSYLLNITNLRVQDFESTKKISSDPVRVCFCKDNQPDCSYHPQPKSVTKGENVNVSLVAVDHINNSIANSTIYAFVTLGAKLGEGQSSQQTNEDGRCTNLTYSVFSPYNASERLKLKLYADGPCTNVGISTTNITVLTKPCPLGFQDSNERCECDAKLHPEYISNCSIDTETVERKGNAWFSYVNTTHHQGYILHKYCPFDYCKQPAEKIFVNLNIENGANKLCTFNRSGKLCGTCKDGLSLSLGSSHCRPCSNNWLALLIVFALAGIALVAIILKLNITVAEGTFNGLIFYANIFVANRAIFFPCDETKILTLFIAWLNLDFGFETCFYDGMDGYVKIWLQFAFPLYVISLVVAIITISDISPKFARLVTAGKNPIATLATLILLSYTKLLRTIINSLSVTKLQYSDGSHELVWLIDANISYLRGKHIPLFVTALIIAIVGTGFTLILFAWQWLIHCPSRGPLRWIIGNGKFIAFINAYHNPYNKDHRYWIGLQLIVRVFLYLTSAVNVLGDPKINLLSIVLAIMINQFLKQIVESKHKVNDSLLIRKVHKDTLVEILEAISLLNLGVLSGASFITEDEDSQNIVAYISTSITFVIFVALLGYHVYKFVLIQLFNKITFKFHTQTNRQESPLPVNNTVSATLTNIQESLAETVTVVNASPEDLLTRSLNEDEDQQLLTEDETSHQFSHEINSLLLNEERSVSCPPVFQDASKEIGLKPSSKYSPFSPSVLVGTIIRDKDGSSEPEDENSPLLRQ